MDIKPEDITITVYSPKEGDVVIVKVPEISSNEEIEQIKQIVQRKVGNDVEVIVCTHDVDFSVLRKAE